MLLNSLREDVPMTPYINTGTLYDLCTGKFLPGVKNSWVLDGGLSTCVGISGRGQTYKSGICGSLLARSMNIHKESEAYIYESEGTVAGAERYDDFVPSNQPVSDRILFKNNTISSLTDFYEDFNKIVENKMKNKKDYLIESPFLNPKTGKPHRIWIPTFVVIDSLSRARSDKGDKQFDDNDIDASGMNSFWLQEGNVKTRLMHDLPGKAARAGIYAIITAHVGNKQDLDPYNKSPKQLQYMKNNDKMKNVGSNFEFLTTTLLQTVKASVLQTKEKTCMYPSPYSTPIEVNQVDTMMVRCKNNSSGISIPLIVSQFQGILDSVTNFEFLKNSNYYGLHVNGNKTSFAPLLDENLNFSRTNIREITDNDYKVQRGLEIMTHLCFIQTLWSTWKMPEIIRTPPEKVAEMLINSKKCSVDRVLQSTGVWTTSKQDRERLTILDILNILETEKLIEMKK